MGTVFQITNLVVSTTSDLSVVFSPGDLYRLCPSHVALKVCTLSHHSIHRGQRDVKEGGVLPLWEDSRKTSFQAPYLTVLGHTNRPPLISNLVLTILLTKIEALGIHAPVRMSLALEEAEPIGFVAVQEYWPAKLRSVWKMFRVATLSKNDACMLGLSFTGLPSLNQDTEIGSDPLTAHSKTTGSPTVS